MCDQSRCVSGRSSVKTSKDVRGGIQRLPRQHDGSKFPCISGAREAFRSVRAPFCEVAQHFVVNPAERIEPPPAGRPSPQQGAALAAGQAVVSPRRRVRAGRAADLDVRMQRVHVAPALFPFAQVDTDVNGHDTGCRLPSQMHGVLPMIQRLCQETYNQTRGLVWQEQGCHGDRSRPARSRCRLRPLFGLLNGLRHHDDENKRSRNPVPDRLYAQHSCLVR